MWFFFTRIASMFLPKMLICYFSRKCLFVYEGDCRLTPLHSVHLWTPAFLNSSLEKKCPFCNLRNYPVLKCLKVINILWGNRFYTRWKALRIIAKSKTKTLNIVGMWIKSISKIVLMYLFETDIVVYNF